MGADFVRRAAQSFHRALDRRAIELRTPTLFTADVPMASRTASAELCEGTWLRAGDKVLLRICQEKLVIQQNNATIATFVNPPAEYLNKISSGSGIAGGEVTAVHDLSRMVEVVICE